MNRPHSVARVPIPDGLRSYVQSRLPSSMRKWCDAQDIVQDAAVIALQKAEILLNLTPVQQWKWWITTSRYLITRAHAKCRLRDSFSQSVGTPSTLPPLGEGESSDSELPDRRILLGTALAALPPSWAMIVKLRFEEGLNAQDTAARMGSTVRYVYQSMYRAKRRLKTLVQEKTADSLPATPGGDSRSISNAANSAPPADLSRWRSAINVRWLFISRVFLQSLPAEFMHRRTCGPDKKVVEGILCHVVDGASWRRIERLGICARSSGQRWHQELIRWKALDRLVAALARGNGLEPDASRGNP